MLIFYELIYNIQEQTLQNMGLGYWVVNIAQVMSVI